MFRSTTTKKSRTRKKGGVQSELARRKSLKQKAQREHPGKPIAWVGARLCFVTHVTGSHVGEVVGEVPSTPEVMKRQTQKLVPADRWAMHGGGW